jgi:hypothetical protein
MALPLCAGSITRTVNFSQSDLMFSSGNGNQLVELRGYPALINPGSPAVPEVCQTILIPAGATPTSVELTGEDWITLPGTYDVPPAQPDVRLPVASEAYTPPKVYPRNAAVYASTEPYPAGKIRLMGAGTMSGYRLARVELLPVRYVPATGQLQLATRLSYQLNYADHAVSDLVPTAEQKATFARAVRRIVSNPEDLANFAPQVGKSPTLASLLPAGHYEYVVITASPMDTVLQRLADWKTAKGVPGKVVLVSSIDSNYTGYDLQEKIRNFIKDAYQNWGTIYVLLGGRADYNDSTQNPVPARMANYGGNGDEPCDLYYAGLDGTWDANGNHVYGELDDSADLYSDVYVGRAPIADIPSAQNFVYKVLTYEQNPPPDYIKKMLLPTGILWDNYIETPMQESIARMAGSGWSIARMYDRTGQLSEAAVIDSLDSGFGLGHWEGHGNQDGIYITQTGGPFLTSSDADGLTNGDKEGIAVSIACEIGGWDLDGSGQCFAEHLINRVGGGAVATVMNTRDGYGAPPVAGPSERLDTSFFSGVFGDLYHTGEALAAAKAYWAPYADSGNQFAMQRWCIYDLNLLGDPEMPIWTSVPSNLAVSHNPVVPLGSNVPFTVSVTGQGLPVNGASITLKKGTEVNLSGKTDSTGKATLYVTTSTPGEMSILVSAHNYGNDQDSALVASARYLTYYKNTIKDPAPGGNGDSMLNPGETVYMPLWVRNWGNLTANGVKATLRSLDPSATVLDSVKSVGTITASDSVLTPGNGFQFRAADTCSNGHQLSFRLVCKDTMDSTWSSTFDVPVVTCILNYAGNRVRDPRPNGNNNGRLDPGEKDSLFLSLCNTGSGRAYNVHATLRSHDSRFQILDSTSSYSRICCDTTGENTSQPFYVHIDSSVAPETSFPCTLFLAGDNYYSAVLPVTVEVGQLRPTDPIHDNATPPIYWAVDNVDSGYTYRPDFHWIEARGEQCLHLGADQSQVQTLPAAFDSIRFYNQRSVDLTICSNGWVAPGMTSNATGGNTSLPTSAIPGAICANWTELSPTYNNNVWVWYDTADHAYVIEYDSLPYADSTLGADKFEILIYDATRLAANGTNQIVVQYLTTNGYQSSTLGIQDPTQQYAICCLFDTTYNRGTAQIKPHSAIAYTANLVGAGIDNKSAPAELPLRLSLNVPGNPFRGTAHVAFALPAAMTAKLTLYDAAGRQVRVLTARGETYAPGAYVVSWNGRDEAGRTVPGGVYFCRLETPHGALACKIVKLD